MKICITLHDFDNQGVKMLSPFAECIDIRAAGARPNEDELCELVETYDILIIGIREIMTPRVYSHVKNLRILGTLSIGIDHIDKVFFDDDRIKVFNCPDSNVPSVGEHTFALALALYKKLFESHVAVIQDVKLEARPRDLYQKTIGVVGAGKIGRRVIELGKAFGMNVLCYTFHPENHQDLLNHGVTFVSLDELFGNAQIISIHLPFTDQSSKLISSNLINSMRPDAVLINTSRMKIVDNDALYDALETNRIMGAAMDGDFDNSDLKRIETLSNIIVTPHTAGTTSDANMRIDTDLAKTLVKELTRF